MLIVKSQAHPILDIYAIGIPQWIGLSGGIILSSPWHGEALQVQDFCVDHLRFRWPLRSVTAAILDTEQSTLTLSAVVAVLLIDCGNTDAWPTPQRQICVMVERNFASGASRCLPVVAVSRCLPPCGTYCHIVGRVKVADWSTLTAANSESANSESAKSELVKSE